MVKKIYQLRFCWLIFVMFLSVGSVFGEIKVTAEAEGPIIYENTPIKVLVTISHATEQKIDLSSFKAGGKSVEAKLIDEKVMTASGDLQLSMFHIELTPLAKGLHLVPEVQVSVAGKIHRSIPTTFEVRTAAANTAPAQNKADKKSSPNPATSSKLNETAFLKFESFVDGPKTLYPGQKTLVGYRFIFNTNLETTAEETPLLEAKGLEKIGDKIVEEDEKDGVSTLKITQIVKGDKPGNFTYGPSTLEAIPYQIKPGGERINAANKISSTAAAININVLPFPIKEKPPSFNGALGDFDWKINLASSPTLSVGDELILTLEVTGIGDWDTVNLPELCCQPSIGGQFRLSDLPVVGKLEGNIKRFELHMIPLTASMDEIPSLEFSALNPDTGKYRVIETAPIPIKIVKTDLLLGPKPTTQANEYEGANNSLPKEIDRVQPIEIPGNAPLKSSDLYNLTFGNWWVLFLIPFGIGLLIFQFNWINFLAKTKEEIASGKKKSATLFKEALESPTDSAMQYSLLNQALMAGLKEIGEIQDENMEPTQLKSNGLQGEMLGLIYDMDAKRYAGYNGKGDKTILSKAESLFKKIAEKSDE